MPYVLNVIDNWDHHEGRGIDEGTYSTADEVVAAAKAVIDKSLRHIWAGITADQGKRTAANLYERWTWWGDNTYIFEDGGVPPVAPHFNPYEFAEADAAVIANEGMNV